MSKKITISSPEEARNYVSELSATARATSQSLATTAQRLEPLEFLAKMKFEKIGYDPLDLGRSLNIIEQLSQTFTYLASFLAVEYLYKIHPEISSYHLNLGTESGHDIESDDEQILCEVFAAVDPHNNGKLRKDASKLHDSSSKHKYIFFISRNYSQGIQPSDALYPDVEVYSLGLSPTF